MFIYSFFINIINNLWYGNQKSKINIVLKILLSPFSVIYIFAHLLDLIINKISRCQSRCKVICIGNINVGGVGKTQIAIAIGSLFIENGRRFCYLTSGYGRKSKNNQFIEFLNPGKMNASKCGDEPLLLSEFADVFISQNRIEMIKHIEKIKLNDRFKYDIIIMDDGLHEVGIRQDYRIIVADCVMQFGNNLCLPMGPNRTPLHFVKNIDAVYLMRSQNFNVAFQKVLMKMTENIFQIGNITNIDAIDRDSKYIAFSGLGMNEKFFHSLSTLRIVKTVHFPDHYSYVNRDLKILLEDAKKLNAKLITTTKDLVKLKYLQCFDPNAIDVLEINAIIPEDACNHLIKNL